MGRHYSTRDFFRQMPNRLLARYFNRRGVLAELDFTALKETQPEPLFTAWLELPEIQRNAMDAEFRDIFAMSCEKGFRAILDEAEWHFRETPQAHEELVEKLAGLANHYERAMTAFLNHADFWKGATLFYHADTLPYWRKRKGLPHQAAAVHADGRRAVSACFHNALKVWDVETGMPLATFTCDAAAYCCAFMNDHKLIGGDAAGRVHFLELEEPKAKC